MLYEHNTGVHPQICVFLLQSFCLKSYNQNNNNNNNNSDKNPHKLLVVLQLSTRGIPVIFSSICTEIKQEKLKDAVHEAESCSCMYIAQMRMKHTE